jgi:subtilisin family serine protease
MQEINAQSEYYYYYQGERYDLSLDMTKVNVVALSSLQSSLSNPDIELIEFQSIPQTDMEYVQQRNILKANAQVITVAPFVRSLSSTSAVESIGTSAFFYVKLFDSDDYSLLEDFAAQNAVNIVQQNQFMPLWYRLSVTASTQGTSLDMANAFYETGLFEDVDPAFIFNFQNNCTNDTQFGQLWGLYNSSNTAIDINACDAWTITRGAGIKVAVLDNGIHKTHLDLASNISTLSFDARSGTSPSVFISGNTHGTHVAGTIGAIRNNNRQVVGVAPEATLISVSHNLSTNPTVSEQFANGINWAWQHGADVINNSWGDQGGALYGYLHSVLLENAISNALTQGRNSKGTIVVFASGNWGVIDYPGGFYSDILCVGAINSSGIRGVFNSYQSSGYGTQLDVVAPGVNILSTLPNNTTGLDSGTSMAAPHVAGIAALILSVNPDLTVQ